MRSKGFESHLIDLTSILKRVTAQTKGIRFHFLAFGEHFVVTANLITAGFAENRFGNAENKKEALQVLWSLWPGV